MSCQAFGAEQDRMSFGSDGLVWMVGMQAGGTEMTLALRRIRREGRRTGGLGLMEELTTLELRMGLRTR